MSIWHKLIQHCFYVWAIVVPLIFLTNTTELFELPKFLLTCFLAILILIFWLLRCFFEKKLIFRRTALDKPLIIFLVLGFVSWSLSVDRTMSWWGYYSRWNGGLLSWLVYSLLYWSAVSNLDRKHALYIVNCSLFIAVLVSLWAIGESTGHSFSCLLVTHSFDVGCWVQKVQERVFASLGQPNWLAAYLLALLPLPLSLSLLKERDVRVRWLSALGSALMFLALYLTHSRSGFLALGVGSIVYASFTYSKKLLWLLIPIIFVATTYTLLLLHSSTLPNSGTESVGIRVRNVWPGAIAAWASSPKTMLIGWGPETFSIAYARYRPASHNLTSEWELLYNKAHNEYLNTLTTTGLLGLLAYLYLLYTICANFVTKCDNRLTVALFAGWTTLLVTNFWGFSVTLTNTLLLLLPALALTL